MREEAIATDIEKMVTSKEGNSEAAQDRNLQVVCFNYGQIGHFSFACNRPKVCFICHSSDLVVDLCPNWMKPPVTAEYFGSLNNGLGFYYVDVEARDNRFKHWEGMDNFGVISIEEGEIDDEGILENLRQLFDKDWAWQLKKTDECSYIVRFPPDRKVEKLVIGKALVFDMNKPGVVVSVFCKPD